MKPRVFIGSSKESLSIAYAIQETLDRDGDITVWTQGIFKLSSNALDDLISSLDGFDYAIFIFQPDDILIMREVASRSIRDNVLFELGLFIGRLGKQRVFYLVPQSSQDLHLPSDLLGYSYGTYNDSRDDNNLLASVGPFCNQVRQELNKFIYLSLTGFDEESKNAREIITSKGAYWEFDLAVELFETKLAPINKSLLELETGRYIQRKVLIDVDDFFKFAQATFETFVSLAEQLLIVLKEVTASFGAKGVAGKPIEIKNAIDRVMQICKELLFWEYELDSMTGLTNLKEIKTAMKGWSRVIIDEVNTLPIRLREAIDDHRTTGVNQIRISLNIDAPTNMDDVVLLLSNLR